MADVYEHVTPTMRQEILDALQGRWENSLTELTDDEYAKLRTMVPSKLLAILTQRDGREVEAKAVGVERLEMISSISPPSGGDNKKTPPPS